MRKYCTPEERKWQNYGKKDEDISKKIIGYFRFTDTFVFDDLMNVTTKFLPGWNALGRPFEILRGEKAQIIGAWTCLTHSTILRFFSLDPVFISAKQLSWDTCLFVFSVFVSFICWQQLSVTLKMSLTISFHDETDLQTATTVTLNINHTLCHSGENTATLNINHTVEKIQQCGTQCVSLRFNHRPVCVPTLLIWIVLIIRPLRAFYCSHICEKDPSAIIAHIWHIFWCPENLHWRVRKLVTNDKKICVEMTRCVWKLDTLFTFTVK